jgi:hypothetical protein
MPTCTEEGCENEGTVELHIPWAANRVVCLAHARSWSQKDGVVADPLDEADEELP